MARKQYLWLPYTSEINLHGDSAEFIYKGGREELSYKSIHSIMFYGKTVPLEQEFLESSVRFGFPIVIHRRNMAKAVWINSSIASSKEDLLTRQIFVRENQKKRSYVAKRLLEAKFASMEWLIPSTKRIKGVTNINRMREIEAWHANRYWKKFYELLGIESTRRTKDNIVTTTLDAVSKFVSGVTLRWILYHHLSPYHGFVHVPTDYPSLVYDMLEPYRGYIDRVVFKSIKSNLGTTKQELGIIAAAIDETKVLFNTKVYISCTRQVVTFHELVHGLVLAFRSYLLGDSKRFIVPLPTRPNGGRPIKSGYLLYGHKAGKTDFWPSTRKIAEEFDDYTNL